MPHSIDNLMQQASRKLASMEYLDAERLCLAALAEAKAAGDFDRYARIVMPLQESRRQRRQIAADAGVFVLAGERLSAVDVLRRHPRGCLLMIDPPYTIEDVRAIRRLASEQKRHVEAILAGAESLRSCFEHEMERQGDAALASVDASGSALEQLEALEKVVGQSPDHEIAHQRLAEAARRLAGKPSMNTP
jgi:hypothetical protein